MPFGIFTHTIALVGAVAQGAPGFVPIPMPQGHNYSEALAVSADGTTAVGIASGPGFNQQSFRWSLTGGLQPLGLWNGGTTQATAVSGDGAIVVGWGHPNAQTGVIRSWRWTASNPQYSDLGNLPGQENQSTARALSHDGQIVGGSVQITGPGTVAMRWTPQTGMQNLGDLPGGLVDSAINGMSADGTVMVGRGYATSLTAVRWTEATGLQPLGITGVSEAYACSADGLTIVGARYVATNGQAFRWTESGGAVFLGFAPQHINYSVPLATSGAGDFIVGYGKVASGEDRAAIWDAAHGMRDLKNVLTTDFGLDLSGWTLSRATGISMNGQTIVGFGINPQGQTQSWMVTVPAPGAATILIVGAALVRRRRRFG